MTTTFRTLRVSVLTGLLTALCVDGSRAGEESASPALPPHALFRLGSLNFLPVSSADRLEYSPDGKYLASASIPEYGTVRPGIQIWERRTGRDVTPAKLKGVEASGIAWSPTGDRFVTSHRGDVLPASLNVWTVGKETSKPLNRRKAGFRTVVWSPKGDRIAAREWEGRVFLFDTDGNEQHRLPISTGEKLLREGRMLDFTPDGKRLAVACDKGAQVFDVGNGTLTSEISIDAKNLNGLRVLPDGESVAIATGEGVRIHRIDGTGPGRSLVGEKGVCDLAASQDGRWLITNDFGSGCTAWDLRSGAAVPLVITGVGFGIAVAPDDSEVALSTRRISFLKIGTWQPLSAGEEHHHLLATCLILNGRVWTGEFGPGLREWNFETGKPLRSITRKSGRAWTLAEIDDRHLAVAGGDPRIDIVDMETGDVTATLPGHQPATTVLATSKQRRRLISAGRDGVARGWDLDSKAMVFEVSVGPCRAIASLAVAPNGELFAYTNPDTRQLQVFRVSDGSLLWSAETREFQSIYMPVTFTADSRQVVSLIAAKSPESGPTVWSVGQWDATTGKEQARFECGPDQMVPALAVSPDGKLVALAARIGDGDHGAQLWSLKERTCVATLGGHYDHVRGLCFTPDGKRLITASQDTTALVWDLDTAIKQGITKK